MRKDIGQGKHTTLRSWDREGKRSPFEACTRNTDLDFRVFFFIIIIFITNVGKFWIFKLEFSLKKTQGFNRIMQCL
jgi:hypothetical protein